MGNYREFVRVPGVLPLLFVSTFGRLAYSMVSLAMFFQVLDVTKSVGTAGLAVGVSGGLGAMTAGPRGHLVDRYGQTKPLYAMVPAYAFSCLMLAFFARTSLLAVLLAALVGLTAPPINISIRPLWLDIVGHERVRMAYSVDTAYSNVLQLLGPVFATLIALHVSPTAAMAFCGVSMLIGGTLLAFNMHSRSWTPEAKHPGEVGLLRSPAMRLLALEGAAMGLSMGFVTIGLPALATLSGEQWMAGPLMSAMGIGSIIGAVWAGARAHDIAPANGLRASMGLFAVALLPLPFLPVGPAMMAVILIAWTFAGPAQVFYLEAIDVVRPRGTAVAALGSLWMIEGAAGAIGTALGGNVAQWWGPHVTLALGCVFVIFSPIIFTIGIRGALRPASSSVPKETWSASIDPV
jgi:predicted MFS family arabinose efflux permease